ncbi:hypothetical protein [Hufsiella ginkgonis]|uniref:Uncharacterized protein n=1 Tax=Hufsiella ginkgonis TaxID=2695274 RepID=A0A7K1Y1A8_9SPHI|nr:hypothetical protein [Hufsiella ginkgonis]MXV17034.1 hypothetical protein [Hufsiella ginkgonis]
MHLGNEVNSPGNEFYPSVTRSGNLYFTARLARGYGEEDIVVCESVNGKFRKPVLLDTAINTKGDEFNALWIPTRPGRLIYGPGQYFR